MSGQVEGVRADISACIRELENGQVSPLNIDSPKPCSKQEAFQSLIDYLRSQQYVRALQLLRAYRCVRVMDLYIGIFPIC